jgi:glyoxylase-like metal-dependent hydrolase (beta-lactamase superfamily II)
MNRICSASVAAVAILMAGVANVVLAQDKPPVRGLVQLAPDLYRAQNNNHYTVFLVTSAGIVMSDPINREFATWLKGEFEKRFKGAPVRYVLYTHHDWDHASGGGVFADTAQFVGHETMPEALSLPAGNLSLAPDMRKLDGNGNGRLEKSEAAAIANFDLTDADRDGSLSSAEILRGPVGDVHPPTVTFTDRYRLTLGGKTVEMVHIGEAHAPDSSVVYFPKERVVFGADVMQVKRFPSTVLPTVGSWITAMRTIESLDFDIAATGHALSGTKADIVELRQYLEELSRGVATGVGAGRSLKDIQSTLNWDKYKAWERFGVQPQIHIAQVYEALTGTPR